MRRLFSFTMLLLSFACFSQAQEYLYIHQKDGKEKYFKVEEIEEINFGGEALSTPGNTPPSEVTNIYNGHEAVDLGLSVKWATCNVGATSPEGRGDYYAWGELETKAEYTIANCTYYKMMFAEMSDSKHITNALRILEKEYDVSTVKWGEGWRTPTSFEIEELRLGCKWESVIINGQECIKAIGPNGSFIILPFSGHYDGTDLKKTDAPPMTTNEGCYWSSQANYPDRVWENEVNEKYSRGLKFYWVDKQLKIGEGIDRMYGCQIRPVYEY